MDLQLPMQSVPITTNFVSSNPTQPIQHYVIKFVSDLRQVDGFLRVLRFPPPIKLTTTITEILLKVALNTINQPILKSFCFYIKPFFSSKLSGVMFIVLDTSGVPFLVG